MVAKPARTRRPRNAGAGAWRSGTGLCWRTEAVLDGTEARVGVDGGAGGLGLLRRKQTARSLSNFSILGLSGLVSVG
ncbi:hypothetical protein V6Z11_A05G255500 [Gossypium hirsutum]